LYSSYLSKWREQRARGQLRGLASKRRGRPAQAGAATELAQLQRENQQLRAQLEQAEIIIDVQKKLSKLLGLTAAESESSENE
jgi:transposase